MVFNKSEVSQKYGFYHHFGVQKSTPGSKMWSKYHAFFICFFMFVYMKNLIFWWYTQWLREVQLFRLFHFLMFFQGVCWMALFYAFWRLFGSSGVSCRSQNRLRPLNIINFMVGLLTFSTKTHFFKKKQVSRKYTFVIKKHQNRALFHGPGVVLGPPFWEFWSHDFLDFRRSPFWTTFGPLLESFLTTFGELL